MKYYHILKESAPATNYTEFYIYYLLSGKEIASIFPTNRGDWHWMIHSNASEAFLETKEAAMVDCEDKLARLGWIKLPDSLKSMM